MARQDRLRLSTAIANFLDMRREEDKAPLTLGQNKQALLRLLKSIGDMWTSDLTEEDWQRGLVHLKGKTRAYSNNQRSQYRVFYDYLARKELLSRRMCKLLAKEVIKQAPKPKTVEEALAEIPPDAFQLDPGRFEEFITIAKGLHPRHGAYAVVGAFRANRGKALHEIKIKHVLRAEKRMVVFESKTADLNEDMDMSEIWDDVEEWLKIYAMLKGAPLEQEDYLFPALKPNRTKKFGVQGVRPNRKYTNPDAFIKIAFRMMGYTTKELYRVGTHSLRRAGLTAWLDRAIERGDPNPVATVRKISNHRTDEMLLAYIGRVTKNASLNTLVAGGFFKRREPEHYSNVVQLFKKSA